MDVILAIGVVTSFISSLFIMIYFCEYISSYITHYIAIFLYSDGNGGTKLPLVKRRNRYLIFKVAMILMLVSIGLYSVHLFNTDIVSEEFCVSSNFTIGEDFDVMMFNQSSIFESKYVIVDGYHIEDFTEPYRVLWWSMRVKILPDCVPKYENEDFIIWNNKYLFLHFRKEKDANNTIEIINEAITHRKKHHQLGIFDVITKKLSNNFKIWSDGQQESRKGKIFGYVPYLSNFLSNYIKSYLVNVLITVWIYSILCTACVCILRAVIIDLKKSYQMYLLDKETVNK